MEKFQKIAFCSCQNGDPNTVVCARDIENGTVLMTYKGGVCSQRTLVLISNEYIVGADEHKPLIYVWALNKKDPVHRIHAPGIVRSLCVSYSHMYCVGAIEEKIYIWLICTGQLLRVVDYHMSRVTCLKFSNQRHNFFSADEHGVVAVWSLQSILSSSNYSIHPLTTFNRHSSAISDGHMIDDVIITSSRDCTLKIWRLCTGELLHDWLFESAVLCVATDTMGRYVSAGLEDGSIRVKDTWDKGGHFIKLWTKSPISCLATSGDTSKLLSGSHQGDIKVWDITTRTCVKTMSHKGRMNDITIVTLMEGWNELQCRPSSPFNIFKFHMSEQVNDVNILLHGHQQVSRPVIPHEPTSTSSSSYNDRLNQLNTTNKELFNKLVQIIMD